MMKKYYSASELREKIINEKKLPRTANQKGERHSFIAKIRGSVFGRFSNSKFALR